MPITPGRLESHDTYPGELDVHTVRLPGYINAQLRAGAAPRLPLYPRVHCCRAVRGRVTRRRTSDGSGAAGLAKFSLLVELLRPCERLDQSTFYCTVNFNGSGNSFSRLNRPLHASLVLHVSLLQPLLVTHLGGQAALCMCVCVSPSHATAQQCNSRAAGSFPPQQHLPYVHYHGNNSSFLAQQQLLHLGVRIFFQAGTIG